MIYHGGYGSSFEDNSVLCEYLASHGYVVFGSAFQDEKGGSFNIDGKDGREITGVRSVRSVNETHHIRDLIEW